MDISPFQREEAEREGGEFKFRYLLTETQKRAHIQAAGWQESQQLGSQQGFLCLELQQSLLPLTHTALGSGELCTASQVHLSFNQIH